MHIPATNVMGICDGDLRGHNFFEVNVHTRIVELVKPAANKDESCDISTVLRLNKR